MGEATVQQLTTESALEKTTMSRNVKLLVSMGWIDMMPNDKDAREKLLVLNRSGRAMLKRVWPAWLAAQAHVEQYLKGPVEISNPKKLIKTLEGLQKAGA